MIPKYVEYTIKLNLGSIKLIDDSKIYDEGSAPPTLRDIAVLMYASVGQGVEWALAHEIAIKFNLNYDDVATFISSLFGKYAKMTEEEGYKATFENTPRPYGYDDE